MLKHIFTTPIYKNTLSRELLMLVREDLSLLMIQAEDRPNSTKGGYQSKPTIFETDAKSIKMLQAAIAKEAFKYYRFYYEAMAGKPFENRIPKFDMWGWITTLIDGGFNSPHIHPRSTISGVYYVDTPAEILENRDGKFAGWIGFSDPRSNSQIWPLNEHMTHYHVSPDEGSLILFPSYLSHFVPPFSGSSPRRAIAFNLRHLHSGT